MAELICPSTGGVVDADGEQFERLVQLGFVPIENDKPQAMEQEQPQPKRRGRKPTQTQE